MHTISKLLETFWSRKLFSIILIAFLGFILYGNTLNNELFWDDDQFILENAYIKDVNHFSKFFSENLIAGAGRSSDYWRPALLTVFSIEWHLWGPSPFGFHLTNMLFHITDAILLFLILGHLFKKRHLALFTSLVFLAHPLQTEAVSYANSLGDSLSVFFIFSSILSFTVFRQSGKKVSESFAYYLSLGSFILALMSKETAIITPALITLTDMFMTSPAEWKKRIREMALASAPFYLLGFGYVLLRATVLNFVNTFNLYNETNAFTGSIWTRILTFFSILTIYVSLIFWPYNLHMERSIAVATSVFDIQVLFGICIVIACVLLVYKTYKKYPLISFGVLWFFIALAPTSNILVPINGLLYEHWLYVPLIGIAIFIYAIAEIITDRFPQTKVMILTVTIIIFISLGVRTIIRNNDWESSITFYQKVLKYAPTSYRIRNNLGMELSERGRYEEAEESYAQAIALDATNPIAYHNLANAYKDTNQATLAIENYKQALELDPNFYYSYGALINLYFAQKNYSQAEKVLRMYIAHDPENRELREVLEALIAEEKKGEKLR